MAVQGSTMAGAAVASLTSVSSLPLYKGTRDGSPKVAKDLRPAGGLWNGPPTTPDSCTDCRGSMPLMLGL